MPRRTIRIKIRDVNCGRSMLDTIGKEVGYLIEEYFKKRGVSHGKIVATAKIR